MTFPCFLIAIESTEYNDFKAQLACQKIDSVQFAYYTDKKICLVQTAIDLNAHTRLMDAIKTWGMNRSIKKYTDSEELIRDLIHIQEDEGLGHTYIKRIHVAHSSDGPVYETKWAIDKANFSQNPDYLVSHIIKTQTHNG